MLVFRAGAGLGSEPYVAFVYGENVTSDDERCRKTYITSCSQYYRHNVIDSWDAITISQVSVLSCFVEIYFFSNLDLLAFS